MSSKDEMLEDLKELEREVLCFAEKMILGDVARTGKSNVEEMLEGARKMSPAKLAEMKKMVSENIDDFTEMRDYLTEQLKNDLPGNEYLMSLIKRYEKCINVASEAMRKF